MGERRGDKVWDSDYVVQRCPKCSGRCTSLGRKVTGVHVWPAFSCKKCKHEFSVKPDGLI